MLQFILAMVIIDFIIKIPDYRELHKLHKAGWKGNLTDYYDMKRN